MKCPGCNKTIKDFSHTKSCVAFRRYINFLVPDKVLKANIDKIHAGELTTTIRHSILMIIEERDLLREMLHNTNIRLQKYETMGIHYRDVEDSKENRDS